MIRLIVFFAITALAAFGAVWFANHPGAVSVTWLGQTYQTEVGILVLGVALVALAFAVLVEVLRWLIRLPRRIGRSRAAAKRESGYRHLVHGMMAAAAGDVAGARANVRTAGRHLDEPASLLLVAQTAQLEGDEDRAYRTYKRMLKHRETEFLGLRGLLAHAARDGDRAEALSLARRAHEIRPEAPWVLSTLFDLQTHESDWGGALGSVEAMARNRQVSPETAARRRAVLLHLAASARKDRGRADEALTLARKGFASFPGFAPGAVLLARLANDAGRARLARRTLEKAWRAAPHPDLAAAYADLAPRESAEERLKRFQSLCRTNPDALQSRITLGEAALNARSYAEAETVLEGALKGEPTARVYHLLAQLEQARGGSPKKANAWRERAADARPDHAWVDRATGTTQEAWAPFGPVGDFDGLEWTVPSAVAKLLPGEAPLTPLDATVLPPADARPTPPAPIEGGARAAARGAGTPDPTPPPTPEGPASGATVDVAGARG